MAKPVITFRSIKGQALTYSELDTNFQNLKDATINFTDGSNTLSMDLNDVVTFDDNPAHNLRILVSEETGTISVDNELGQYTLEPMGFENRTDSTMFFSTSTRVFTIQPRSPITEYRVWCHGEMYTKTTANTVTIPNTSDLYYIYFDSDAVLQYKTGTFDFSTDTMVALVQWNSNTSDYYLLGEERHGITMDWATHEYLNATRGIQYASGLAASNYTTSGNGGLDAHAQIDLNNGVLYQEDIKISITHSNSPNYENFEQDLQGPGRFPVIYHDGSTGQWRKDSATDFPVKQGVSRIRYNLNTSGTWSYPDADNNHYVAYWLVGIPNIKDGAVISVMGQRQDVNLANALTNNTWASLELTNFPGREVRPLYRMIFQTGSYGNTVNAKLVDLTDYRTVGVVGEGSTAATSSPAFQNVVAGGLTLTADSASGTLTLVAGTNISINADSTTDTVTINNTGGSITGNTVTVGDNTATNVNIQANTGSGTYKPIQISGYNAGFIEIAQAIYLTPLNSDIKVSVGGPLQLLPTHTTTDRGNFTPQNGMIFYNSTTHKFQGYANGAWIDLH